MRRLMLLALVFSAAPVMAQPDGAPASPPIDVEAVERARDARLQEIAALDAAAAEANAELGRLRAELIASGQAQDRAEREALALEAKLAELDAEAEALAIQVAADDDALFEIAAALQRIERDRAPSVLVTPGDAADAARAARLLTGLTEALAERTAAARQRAATLAALRADVASRRDALRRLEEDLSNRLRDTATQAETAAKLEASLRADAQSRAEAAAVLASQAADLRDLIGQLESLGPAPRPALRPAFDAADAIPIPRLRPDPAITRLEPRAIAFSSQRFADARGTLAPPAAGALSAAPAPRSGVTIATRRRAQVVAPFDARIDYAGLFRGYDGLLILDVGDGYHIILAGLSAVYGVSGQSVLAGEPLGEMPDQRRPTPELYFELRKDGAPIDPGPWLRG